MTYDQLFGHWLQSHWQWWLFALVLYLAIVFALRHDRRKPETEEERKNMEQVGGAEWMLALLLTGVIILSVVLLGSVLFFLVKFVKWAWYH